MNLNMISNYIKAKWSKGFDNKKVDVTTKDIRLLGCFGDGEEISVCPGLRPSEELMGKFICGECGCGDGKGKYLNGEKDEYTKLDHPYLSCPRRMPGFSDYEPSTDKDDLQEKRKKMIELTLGGDILKNKELIKPEMSEEERQKNQTQQEKRQKELSNLKDMITSELEGVGYIKDSDEFKQQFGRMWQEGMQKISGKNTPTKKPCTACENKKNIKNEVIKELRQQGMKEDFKNPEYKDKFVKLFQEKIENSTL